MKRALICWISVAISLLALCSCADTEPEKEEVTPSQYAYAAIQEIEEENSKHEYFLVSEFVQENLQLGKTKISDIATSGKSDEDIIRDIDFYKGLCLDLIDKYVEIDTLMESMIGEKQEELDTYYNLNQDLIVEYNQYIAQHPNFYKGTYAEYQAERKVYSDAVSKAQYNLAMAQKYKAETMDALGLSESDWQERYIKPYKDTIAENEALIKNLDLQWDEWEYIDQLLVAIEDTNSMYEALMDEIFAENNAELTAIQAEIDKIIVMF